MRKILLICVLLTLSTVIFSQSSVKITTLVLNGERFENSGILIDGVTYVPLRVVAEKLGAMVRYSKEENLVEVVSNNPNAIVVSNNPTAIKETTPPIVPENAGTEHELIDSPYVTVPVFSEHSYVKTNSYADTRDAVKDARQEAKMRDMRTYELFLKRVGDSWVNEKTLLETYGVLVIKKGASKIYFIKDDALGEVSTYVITRPKTFSAYVVYKHEGISMQTAYTAEDPDTIYYNVADLKEQNII